MQNRVICGCFNITLFDMEDSISLGVTNFKEFQKKNKIGTGCPPCLASNKILFEKLLSEYRISLLEKILVL